MTTIADVPPFHAFLQPIVDLLKAHGRSMTNEEMADEVAAYMGLSEDARAVRHGKWNQLAVEQRMAFARSYLKKGGAVDNSARGVWSLTPKGAAMTPQEISQVVRNYDREYLAGRKQRPTQAPQDDALIEVEFEADRDWQSILLSHLLKLDPSAFERLCQRLLREAGFTKVEVTGKSGDGGIDGTGVLRMNLLSFQVIFQCKRWQGSVGSSVVRDFRGAMVGRADKGLIITTGTFTAEARKEATRDGAPAIDLVDGEALCELLREHRIGVRVEMVPQVTIDEAALAAL